MDFDLNIEAIVEGDDQALNDLHELMDMEQEKEEPNEDLVVVIDLNAPTSMDTDSSVESGGSDENLVDGYDIVEEVTIVLALQAAPIINTMDEIQRQELLSANPSKEVVLLMMLIRLHLVIVIWWRQAICRWALSCF
jgi:hypothetical protein